MTLTEQLADAKTKYHQLVTGQLAKVFVDSNGERVEFTAANRAELKKYIGQLEAQINGLASGKTASTGPMKVFM